RARRMLALAPPAGFEPARTAPEAAALSPELRGLGRRTTLPSAQNLSAVTAGARNQRNCSRSSFVVHMLRSDAVTMFDDTRHDLLLDHRDDDGDDADHADHNDDTS